MLMFVRLVTHRMDKCEGCKTGNHTSSCSRNMVGIWVDNWEDVTMPELEETVEANVNEGTFVIIYTGNKDTRSLISETLLLKFSSDDVCLEFI